MDILNCKNCKKYNTDQCNCELSYSKQGSVFDHTLAVMSQLPANASFNLQLAALYHDVGKNEKTLQIRGQNKISFIGHEKLGRFITRDRLVKLKFDIKSINYILSLVEHHMDLHRLKEVSDKSVRKFLRECSSFMEDLFLLTDADCKGTLLLDKNNQLVSCPTHKDIQIRAREIYKEMQKISIKPFRYFDGTELMKMFNIDSPCKAVGDLIKIQNQIIDEFGFELEKKKVYQLIKNRFINKGNTK